MKSNSSVIFGRPVSIASSKQSMNHKCGKVLMELLFFNIIDEIIIARDDKALTVLISLDYPRVFDY